MNQTIHIRDARPDEADCLSGLAFRSKAHWGYSPAFMAACRRELTLSPAEIANPAYRVRLAEHLGSVAGFHALAQGPDGTFELDALFVEPDRLGHGLGSVLLADAASQALALGGRSILIQGDPHAEGFYRKAGAAHAGERESGSIAGRMLPLFLLALDPTVRAAPG